MTTHPSLALPDGSLIVFVDDTGHEALVPGQPVYGLGGCAVMSEHLNTIIQLPWQEVRRKVTGSPNTPLHASDFSRGSKRDDIEAVASFFHNQPFARLGAIISINTQLVQDHGPVPTVLQNRIVDIARTTPFKELHVIFEASQRADPLVEDAMQGFGLEENGQSIPVECYFMPKCAG
jgi:hypothetical protein